MKLSEAEKKMVARLRKRKESFPRQRRVLLLSSVINIVAGVILIIMFFWAVSKYPPDVGHFNEFLALAIVMTPLGLFLLLSGVYLLTDTLVNWHGRPEVDLLLRLIEESRDKADEAHSEN